MLGRRKEQLRSPGGASKRYGLGGPHFILLFCYHRYGGGVLILCPLYAYPRVLAGVGVGNLGQALSLFTQVNSHE